METGDPVGHYCSNQTVVRFTFYSILFSPDISFSTSAFLAVFFCSILIKFINTFTFVADVFNDLMDVAEEMSEGK